MDLRNQVLVLFLLVAAVGYGTGPVGAEEPAAVELPGGSFTMGSTYCADQRGNDDWCADEVPHSVQLDPFFIDRHEVTNAEYTRCVTSAVCGLNGTSESRPGDFSAPDQPVVFVTWENARKFCAWRGARLPSEAEWEFAARAEKLGGAIAGMPYDSGAPKPVGSLELNSYGLYDMLGNVYEWTADWYAAYGSQAAAVENPKGPAAGRDKVVRGGSWNSPAHYLRASDRVARAPELQYSDVGFRCARSR